MNTLLLYGYVISSLMAVGAVVMTVAACAFWGVACLYVALAEIVRAITGRNNAIDLPEDRQFIQSTHIARAMRRKAARAEN